MSVDLRLQSDVAGNVRPRFAMLSQCFREETSSGTLSTECGHAELDFVRPLLDSELACVMRLELDALSYEPGSQRHLRYHLAAVARTCC